MNTEQTNHLPPTEAVETSAAVPTDLAWSHEQDTTELTSRRDWRDIPVLRLTQKAR